MLGSLQNDLGLNVSGVYSIPCECAKVHMGQTGQSIEARCKERTVHLHLSTGKINGGRT
jgi:hypothetical protein